MDGRAEPVGLTRSGGCGLVIARPTATQRLPTPPGQELPPEPGQADTVDSVPASAPALPHDHASGNTKPSATTAITPATPTWVGSCIVYDIGLAVLATGGLHAGTWCERWRQ